MQLSYDAGRGLFVFRCTFNERSVPAKAGFVWNNELKRWATDEVGTAAALSEFSDDSAKKVLSPSRPDADRSLQASRATDCDIEIPVPQGLTLLPYQKAGVAFAAARHDTLLADEMGLGKTPSSIALCNYLNVSRVLFITLASLKINTKREWERWTTLPDITVGIADGKKFPDTDVVIINYDILHKHHDAIRAVTWDVLICDEAHALQNPEAKRTIHVLGGGKGRKKKKVTPIPAKRRLFMTGTPMTSRPVNLWPICKAFDPTGLGADWMKFTKRYCEGWTSPWGYDASGAAHLDELGERLRQSFMIRRTKDQVLKDLPPKRRQIIELPADGIKTALRRELDIYNATRPLLDRIGGVEDIDYTEHAKNLSGPEVSLIEEMAAIRQEVALAKLPMVCEFIDGVLATGEKLVVFVYHRAVAAALKERYQQAALVTGSVPQRKRQDEVDRFQRETSCNLFIGQITAAGAGLTLTASSKVGFAEIDWTYSGNAQAEDRVHRIGQTADSVNIYYLVLEGSLDAQIMKSYVDKESNIVKALNG